MSGNTAVCILLLSPHVNAIQILPPAYLRVSKMAAFHQKSCVLRYFSGLDGTAEWSSNKIPACCVQGAGFEPWVGTQN